MQPHATHPDGSQRRSQMDQADRDAPRAGGDLEGTTMLRRVGCDWVETRQVAGNGGEAMECGGETEAGGFYRKGRRGWGQTRRGAKSTELS